MSKLGQELGFLESTHRGVEEQFDFLIVAMQVQAIACNELLSEMLTTSTEKEKKKWFQETLCDMWLRVVGKKPGFLQRGLLTHVYMLYEQFFERYTTVLKFKEGTSLKQVQFTILPLAASFLDNQFKREKLADICAFLKWTPKH